MPNRTTRRGAALGALAALALTAPLAAQPASARAAACPGADLIPSQANLPTVRRATLCLLNVERRRRGRVSLHFNRSLAQVANGYARKMVSARFFDHVSPGGSTLVSRIESTPYLRRTSAWSLGENLAWGSGTLASPRATVRAWMNSAGHRRNILDRRFREIGIGVALGVPVAGQPDGATYATEFGTRVR